MLVDLLTRLVLVTELQCQSEHNQSRTKVTGGESCGRAIPDIAQI